MEIFIYVLRDPDTKLPKYVGKSNSQRIAKRIHEHHQLPRLKRNNYKNNWIKKLLNAGKRAELLIVDVVDENNFRAKEAYWIRAYLKLGILLTNSTVGGEGLARFKQKRIISQEQKVQISNTLKRFFEDPINLEISRRGGKACRGRIKSKNTSGFPGVSKVGDKWRATATVDYKQKHLGLFTDPTHAHQVYLDFNNNL